MSMHAARPGQGNEVWCGTHGGLPILRTNMIEDVTCIPCCRVLASEDPPWEVGILRLFELDPPDLSTIDGLECWLHH